MLGSGHFIIRLIRLINPAVAVLTLLTLGHAQTRLALLSLTRKVRGRFLLPFGLRRNPVCRDSSNLLGHG